MSDSFVIEICYFLRLKGNLAVGGLRSPNCGADTGWALASVTLNLCLSSIS